VVNFANQAGSLLARVCPESVLDFNGEKHSGIAGLLGSMVQDFQNFTGRFLWRCAASLKTEDDDNTRAKLSREFERGWEQFFPVISHNVSGRAPLLVK
jgi:hypothetical protein